MKTSKRIQYKKESMLLILFASLFLISGSYANENQNSTKNTEAHTPLSPNATESRTNRTQRKPPPQSAIDACSGKAEGDACQFQGPRGNVPGDCGYSPDKKYFTCRPNRPPPQDNSEE
jgi:hypothetical protein